MLQAQITAPGSNAVRRTKFPVSTRVDSVYIFCTNDASDRGTLTAASPGGSPPFTFTWTRYDNSGGAYSIAVKTESGLTSTATGLIEGGYKVNITDGGTYNTSLYAWVNLDKPVAYASLKDNKCDMVALNGDTASDPFYYYDPVTGTSRRLRNSLAFEWSSTPASSIPYPTFILDPITYNPPLVDVSYMLQVTDSFGCVGSSSFDYPSIHVRASFVADPTPATGEAPFEVAFTNNSASLRPASYLWTFGDGSVSDLADPGPHTYYIPDKYEVTLTIESDLFCSDDTTVMITVEPSALQMPNVFSPNGDDINDFFVPEKKSLKYINVQIFAKSGRRVYYFEGNGEAIQDWTGWDGKINNSERYAEPGVYFYIIRAVGYDEKEYKGGKEYRNALYLFR